MKRPITAAVFTLFFSVISTLALAEDVQVWGRVYDLSCGYFSRRAADMSVTLKDAGYPFGTDVKLIAGFAGSDAGGGRNLPVSWVDRVEVAASAIDTSTWEAKILNKTMHSRTDGRFLDRMQFTFVVSVPGQPVRYVNGGTTWGYFETENLSSNVPCVNGESFPAWRSILYAAVARD